MIRWTGLVPWDLEFPFPGSLASTFLAPKHSGSFSRCQVSSFGVNALIQCANPSSTCYEPLGPRQTPRFFICESRCQGPSATRRSTTLSSKVNVHHAIKCRAFRKIVGSKFQRISGGDGTLVAHRVAGDEFQMVVQGYLAHKKQQPPRTLHPDYA